jgi:competence protein ComEC
VLAAAGALRIYLSENAPRPAYGKVELRGVVTETGVTGSGNPKMVARVKDSDLEVNVMIYARQGQEAEAGQAITVAGELLPLETPRNPGGYNEYQYLRARKIAAKIFPDTLETGKTGGTLQGMLNRVQQRLAAVYDAALPQREAAVIKSVILGDKAGLDEDVRELYRLAGIYHLLCISGLHVSILMLAMDKLLSFKLNKRVSGLITLAVMVLYCLLTGSSVSTVRAVTMGGVLVFARVLYREYDLLASVSFAGIVLLLYEPMYLFDAGFQLSFGAVSGIAVMTNPVERGLSLLRCPKSIKTALAANIAATAATFPILSYHFYYLSPYSIIVNCIILPTAAVLVVFGLLVGLVGLIWLPAGMFLSGVIYYLLLFYDFVCNFFTGLPGAVLKTGCCGLMVCAAAYCVMAAFGFTMAGFGDALRKRAAALGLSIVFFMACAVAYALPSRLEITVLDAGAESLSVLRYKNGMFAVGDALQIAENFADYFEYLGRDKLDGVFYTGDSGNWINENNLAAYGDLKFTVNGEKLYIALGEADICFYGGVSADEPLPPAEVTVWKPQGYSDGRELLKNAQSVILNGIDYRYDSFNMEPLRENNRPAYSTAERGAVSLGTDGERVYFE